MKETRGRKKLARRVRRSHMIYVRVSARELELLKSKAGDRKLSVFIRGLIKEA